jgi:hypothetical protein
VRAVPLFSLQQYQLLATGCKNSLALKCRQNISLQCHRLKKAAHGKSLWQSVVYFFIFRNSAVTKLMTRVNILISDAPSDSVYMMSGMLIAMLLVAVIIVLLAVTIRSLKIVSTSTEWRIYRPI